MVSALDSDEPTLWSWKSRGGGGIGARTGWLYKRGPARTSILMVWSAKWRFVTPDRQGKRATARENCWLSQERESFQAASCIINFVWSFRTLCTKCAIPPYHQDERAKWDSCRTSGERSRCAAASAKATIHQSGEQMARLSALVRRMERFIKVLICVSVWRC